MSAALRIRVLVVDDSAVARRFITRRLEKDDELEVVGTSASGTGALARIQRDPPDVVILDEEMPDMRGRDVLKVLRKEHPTVAVVMFSGHVGRGSQARFEALLCGADDAVGKPTSAGGPIDDDHPTWAELLTKTKAAARRPDRGGVHVDVARRAGPAATGVPAGDDGAATVPAPATVRATRAARRVPAPARRRGAGPTSDTGVVVIGSSTGGPDALSTVLSSLPADFALPILVVQHMPPSFTRLLAERLDGRCQLDVAEAAGGERLRPGIVLVAPGDRHLVVQARPMGCEARLDDGPPENSCRPAADVLFRSAAQAYGDRVVACVISGMGQDGMLGAVSISDAGGTVLAQDEATSVVWGMPGSVVGAGVADAVLPLDRIGAELAAAAWRLQGAVRRQEVVS